MVGSGKHTSKLLDSITCKEFLGKLNIYQLLKDSAPWSLLTCLFCMPFLAKFPIKRKVPYYCTTFSFVKKRKKLSFIEQCSCYVLERFLGLDVSLKTSEQAWCFSWLFSIQYLVFIHIPLYLYRYGISNNSTYSVQSTCHGSANTSILLKIRKKLTKKLNIWIIQ
jgi:hypothetical protein